MVKVFFSPQDSAPFCRSSCAMADGMSSTVVTIKDSSCFILAVLSKKQVLQFDLRMTVLAVRKRFVSVCRDSLLCADVDASEADSTMVAEDGFAVREADVIHWADAYACIASDTLVGIYFWPQIMNHASLNSRSAE